MLQSPFLPVDCGSLVPTLVESELFGYVKGAFTGANHSKDGLLVSAGGGTVFLDEIGELTLDLQAKLLRALQEKEVRPVGSTQRIPIRARILTATNRDLAAMVDNGTFRKDLYYRLNVVNLRLPALRDRKDDIPMTGRALSQQDSSRSPWTVQHSRRCPAHDDAVRLAGQCARTGERSGTWRDHGLRWRDSAWEPAHAACRLALALLRQTKTCRIARMMRASAKNVVPLAVQERDAIFDALRVTEWRQAEGRRASRNREDNALSQAEGIRSG